MAICYTVLKGLFTKHGDLRAGIYYLLSITYNYFLDRITNVATAFLLEVLLYEFLDDLTDRGLSLNGGNL